MLRQWFLRQWAAHNIMDDARHPCMHRTDTLDYVMVVKGEIWMVMEEDDVLLTEGTVVVQRANFHAWANRVTEPCIMMFVLTDGEGER